MLGLKLATDPRWVNIVEKNISEILTDHAFCEQKAASNAISMIVLYSEYSDLVTAMAQVAQEEMMHFEMVHQKIKESSYELGRERKDWYVQDLMKFINQASSKHKKFIDRLLIAAMIEARSCERFRLLSIELNDEDLKNFYHELMISEANHYKMFISFEKKYADGVDVEKRWQEFLNYEAEIMSNYGNKETVHG